MYESKKKKKEANLAKKRIPFFSCAYGTPEQTG